MSDDPREAMTEEEIVARITSPGWQSRLEMLQLAIRTGTCTLQLAAMMLGLPTRALGAVLAELLLASSPDDVIRVELSEQTVLLLCRSPEASAAMLEHLLAANPDAPVSVIAPSTETPTKGKLQ